MDQESQHRKEICETNRENIRKRYDGSTTVPTTVPTTVVRRSSSSSSSSSSSFDTFWSAYPKKKSKGDAEKAWGKIKPPLETLALILEALEWQRTSPGWTKDSGQYIPHPASYLRSQGWLDERTTPPRPKTGFACNDGYIGAGQPLLDLLDPTPEPEDEPDEQ
jgi:hypothetical protein